MSLLATGLLVVSAIQTIETIQTPRIKLGDSELAAAYERGCAGAQRAPDCDWLQRELEVRLLANLQQLVELEQPIDRDVLRVAVRADFPLLAIFGLERFSPISDAEDAAAVAWAMDHPSPGVRAMARRVAQQSGYPTLAAFLGWSAESDALSNLDPIDSDDWAAAMLPQEARTLRELGLPEFAATYRPSLSDATLLVFTTAERPERALAVLAKGTKTLGSEEMIERYTQADMSGVEKLSKQMEGVTDQAKLMEMTMTLQQAMMEAMKPMANLRLIHDPEGRYWELVAGNGLPRRLVGVGRHEQLGVTTISVLLP